MLVPGDNAAYRFYRVAYRFAYRFFVEQVHVHVCARMYSYVRIKIDHKEANQTSKSRARS